MIGGFWPVGHAQAMRKLHRNRTFKPARLATPERGGSRCAFAPSDDRAQLQITKLSWLGQTSGCSAFVQFIGNERDQPGITWTASSIMLFNQATKDSQ
ncbi:hypothetical protein [Variovorax gossypii]